MVYLQRSAMQCDSIVKRRFGTVFTVAEDWASNRFQLSSNLMFSTGNQIDFQLEPESVLSNTFVLENRKFALGRDGRADPSFEIFLAPDEIVFKSRGRLSRATADDSPISLSRRMVAELFTQSTCRFAGSSERHHPRHGRIETANNPNKNLARLAVLFLEIRSRPIEQALLSWKRSLDNPVRWFVKNQQMVVLEKNLHRWKVVLSTDLPSLSTTK